MSRTKAPNPGGLTIQVSELAIAMIRRLAAIKEIPAQDARAEEGKS